MAKMTPEETIIEALEGSRYRNATFKTWSDDTFIGYATAMIVRDNPKTEMRVSEWESLVRKMLKQKRI